MTVSSKFSWNPIKNNYFTLGNASHTRDVFIVSSENSGSLVAKLESCDVRDRKMPKVMPHIEEMAYKICKLFKWTTIPKTKLVHEFSCHDRNSNIKQKYFTLINDFKNTHSNAKSYTFTFQDYVDGNTLPNAGKGQPDRINLPSYQRAILIDMILGKMDARGDNTMIKTETGEIFEIDNEYLGNTAYDRGILSTWSNVKNQIISEQIIAEILNVNNDQLNALQIEFNQKDEAIRKFWSQEDFYTVNIDAIKQSNETWNNIYSNFNLITRLIIDLQEKEENITVERIQAGMEAYYEQQEAALYGCL